MGYEQQIREITASIFQSVLDFPIDENGPTTDVPQPALIGAVQIGGAWKGAVAVECSQALARKASASMFGMAEGEVSSGEMSDALGEITNMVGGNFKALLEGVCQLSLPTVVEGLHLKLAIPGNKLVDKAHFACHGEPMKVYLLVKDE